MNKFLPTAIYLLVLTSLTFSLNAQSSNGYTNPVLRGLNPDPSICRVRNGFYMIFSFMYLYPGVPVYHSRDLINWKMIGYCLTRAGAFL